MQRLPSFALVLVLAVLAAGCGSKSSEPDSTADWADGVCSDNHDLEELDQVQRRLAQRRKPHAGLAEERGRRHASATDTLESDLKDLGKPDTQVGQQAKDPIDRLSSDLKTDTESIKTAVDDVWDLSDVPSAAATVSSTLAKMRNCGSPLPSTVSSSSMATASCRPLSSSRAPASSSPARASNPSPRQ